MAKLTTVTASPQPDEQPTDKPSINIEELANTSTAAVSDNAPEPSIPTEESPLLSEEFLVAADGDSPPKRSGPINDITKNPLANTMAIALLTFGLIGGVSLMWWGISAAQNQVSAIDETDLEAVIEDEKQKEIDALNQKLYEQRAQVALKDLKVEDEEEPASEEDTETADSDDAVERSSPSASSAARPAPTPRRTSTPPPPPPRRVTPTPVNTARGGATSQPNSQPSFDSPNLWHDLAALGQITSTEFDGQALPPPPPTLIASADTSEAISQESLVMPGPQTGWDAADIPVVMVNRTNSNSWPTNGSQLRNREISQGEIGILNQQPVTQPQQPSIEAPAPAPEPGKPDDEDAELVASSKTESSDPWKGLTEDTVPDDDDNPIVYIADDYWDTPGDSDSPLEDDSQQAITDTSEPEASEADTFATPDSTESETIYASHSTTDTWDVEVDPSDGWGDGWSPTDESNEHVTLASQDAASTGDPLLSSTFDVIEQDTIATVAIGSITNAEVITPIVWDQEAPRPTDGIFTIELTEAMLGINNEVVLPEGTRLVANVSYVSDVGHVYQTITAIYLPSGEQMPVPVISHEEGTGAPITPLVVRGKKGEALIADAVERSDGGRSSLGNDLLIGAVNGLADAADNALEPDTRVQVNQGFGGSTVESQSNVNDPTAAFARGFLESTAYRMEERLYEETDEIQVFQVDAGEKVSVVVNGLMSFNIPAEGWPE